MGYLDYLGYLGFLSMHVHPENGQQVAPWGAAPVVLTSGGGAWTFGAFSNDIIAAGVTIEEFDLHWAVISDVSANENYEVEIVYGDTDIIACRCAFTRTNPFTSSISVPLLTRRLPIGSRVRARMRDGTGGNQAAVKVFYHEY